MKKVGLFFAGAILTMVFLTACSDSNESQDTKVSNDSVSVKDTSDSTMTMMDSDRMSGMFEGVDTHKVSGNITIEDGKLKLTNFTTDEGPDLHVYIAKNNNVDEGVDLGEIALDKADQTFDLKDTNPDDYNSILIYCNKAHELFGKAMYETDKVTDSQESGEFIGLNDKRIEGTAKIGGDKLMLSNFKTDEGPDLHVYLMKNDSIEESVDLGKIDLTKSDQTFTIPSDVNISDYNKAAIYCNEAHVLFGEATL